MITHLTQVLRPDEVKAIREELSKEIYGDGRESVSGGAATVKNNLELPFGTEQTRKLGEQVTAALRRNPVFMNVILPKRIGNFIFNRYQSGMTYGDHLDTPLGFMRGGDPMRSDIAITVFLSDPTTYDGGELIIDSDTIPKPVKLPAGDAILYPANTVHRVETVTRGVRVAAVTWIQSLVPDPAQRQILLDMMMVRDFLATNQTPQTLADAQIRATKTYVSLIQMWART